MGEKIEFPKNYTMYLKKAEQNLQQNDAIRALHYIELAYAIKKEPNVNALYVSILVQLERYKEALEMADDFEPMYKNDIQQNALYLFLLIKNHRFVTAESYLRESAEKERLPTEKVIQLESLLKEEIILKKKQHQADMDELQKKLFSLAELGLEEQLKVVEEAIQLNQSELITAVPFVMDNPFVSQIVKSFYLQTMILKNIDYNFRFKASGMKAEINPSQLTSFNEHPVTLAVNEQLDQSLEKNPSLLMAIKPELNFNLLKVFPYLETVIENAKEWVNLSIQFYAPEYENPDINPSLSESEKRMIEWIKKLSEM